MPEEFSSFKHFLNCVQDSQRQRLFYWRKTQRGQRTPAYLGTPQACSYWLRRSWWWGNPWRHTDRPGPCAGRRRRRPAWRHPEGDQRGETTGGFQSQRWRDSITSVCGHWWRHCVCLHSSEGWAAEMIKLNEQLNHYDYYLKSAFTTRLQRNKIMSLK